MPFLAIPAVAASIIGGGAAVGSALIAKKGSDNIANTQQNVANQALARSTPAYNASYGYYNNLLNNPLQSPDVNNAVQQFAQARRNLVNSTYSRGGGLDAGLSNLEAGKAVTMSNLISSGRQTAASALGNLANNQQIAGLQGLAGAQQSQAQNSQLTSQALNGVGSFITRLISSGAFGGGGNNNNSWAAPQTLGNPLGDGTGIIPAAIQGISPNLSSPSAGTYLPVPAQTAAIPGQWINGIYAPGNTGY